MAHKLRAKSQEQAEDLHKIPQITSCPVQKGTRIDVGKAGSQASIGCSCWACAGRSGNFRHHSLCISLPLAPSRAVSFLASAQCEGSPVQRQRANVHGRPPLPVDRDPSTTTLPQGPQVCGPLLSVEMRVEMLGLDFEVSGPHKTTRGCSKFSASRRALAKTSLESQLAVLRSPAGPRKSRWEGYSKGRLTSAGTDLRTLGLCCSK